MSYKLITAAFSLLVASGCHSSASDDRKQATKRADGAPIFRSKFGDCDERVSPSANMKPNLGGFPIVSSIDVSNQYVGLIGELSYSETVKRGLDWDKDGFLENKINAERYFDRTDLLEDFSIDKRAISLQDAFVIVSSRPAPCPGEGGVCAKPDLEGGYLMTGLSTFGSAAKAVRSITRGRNPRHGRLSRRPIANLLRTLGQREKRRLGIRRGSRDEPLHDASLGWTDMVVRIPHLHVSDSGVLGK